MKILVFAPHPDDEIIGIGGTILRHIKTGDEVGLMILTKAHEPYWSKEIIAKKTEEVHAVSKFMGIKRLFWEDFKTGSLNSVPSIELLNKIETVVADFEPDIIYAPPKGDVHIDHDIVGILSLSVSKRFRSVIKLFFYEEPQNTAGNSSPFYFVPNYFVDVTAFIDKKMEALDMYQTEKKDFPHPRSSKALKLAAAERGRTIGVEFAESLMLVKEIVK